MVESLQSHKQNSVRVIIKMWSSLEVKTLCSIFSKTVHNVEKKKFVTNG